MKKLNDTKLMEKTLNETELDKVSGGMTIYAGRANDGHPLKKASVAHNNEGCPLCPRCGSPLVYIDMCYNPYMHEDEFVYVCNTCNQLYVKACDSYGTFYEYVA